MSEIDETENTSEVNKTSNKKEVLRDLFFFLIVIIHLSQREYPFGDRLQTVADIAIGIALAIRLFCWILTLVNWIIEIIIKHLDQKIEQLDKEELKK